VYDFDYAAVVAVVLFGIILLRDETEDSIESPI
jgi:hypothetical protein